MSDEKASPPDKESTMSKGNAEFTGLIHRTDGTVEACSNGDRWIMRIDDEHLTLDPEVTIEGAGGYYTLRAPFTETTVKTVPQSRILCHDQGWTVDQPRILAEAQATGQLVFRLGDYVLEG